MEWIRDFHWYQNHAVRKWKPIIQKRKLFGEEEKKRNEDKKIIGRTNKLSKREKKDLLTIDSNGEKRICVLGVSYILLVWRRELLDLGLNMKGPWES